jgi:hypothetical protein
MVAGPGGRDHPGICKLARLEESIAAGGLELTAADVNEI